MYLDTSKNYTIQFSSVELRLFPVLDFFPPNLGVSTQFDKIVQSFSTYMHNIGIVYE
jgi:hypothetical protein